MMRAAKVIEVERVPTATAGTCMMFGDEPPTKVIYRFVIGGTQIRVCRAHANDLLGALRDGLA